MSRNVPLAPAEPAPTASCLLAACGPDGSGRLGSVRTCGNKQRSRAMDVLDVDCLRSAQSSSTTTALSQAHKKIHSTSELRHRQGAKDTLYLVSFSLSDHCWALGSGRKWFDCVTNPLTLFYFPNLYPPPICSPLLALNRVG